MVIANRPVWMPETVQAEWPSVAELVLPSERAVAERAVWLPVTARPSDAELVLRSEWAVAVANLRQA